MQGRTQVPEAPIHGNTEKNTNKRQTHDATHSQKKTQTNKNRQRLQKIQNAKTDKCCKKFKTHANKQEQKEICCNL